jgi:hypothetical protein
MTNQDNNITEEIIDMAPILAALPKSKLHRVPENYFDDVESNIISQLNLIKNEKSQDQKVPADYFESLDDVILNKIVSLPASRFNYMKYAAILVVLIASLVAFNFLKPQENAQMASELTQAETIDYMVEHAEDFDINMLIDHDIIDETTLDGLSYITIEEEENADIFESDF